MPWGGTSGRSQRGSRWAWDRWWGICFHESNITQKQKLKSDEGIIWSCRGGEKETTKEIRVCLWVRDGTYVPKNVEEIDPPFCVLICRYVVGPCIRGWWYRFVCLGYFLPMLWSTQPLPIPNPKLLDQVNSTWGSPICSPIPIFKTFLKRDMQRIIAFSSFPYIKISSVVNWLYLNAMHMWFEHKMGPGYYCRMFTSSSKIWCTCTQILTFLIPCLFYFISQKKSVAVVLFSVILVSRYKTAMVIPFFFPFFLSLYSRTFSIPIWFLLIVHTY